MVFDEVFIRFRAIYRSLDRVFLSLELGLRLPIWLCPFKCLALCDIETVHIEMCRYTSLR